MKAASTFLRPLQAGYLLAPVAATSITQSSDISGKDWAVLVRPEADELPTWSSLNGCALELWHVGAPETGGFAVAVLSAGRSQIRVLLRKTMPGVLDWLERVRATGRATVLLSGSAAEAPEVIVAEVVQNAGSYGLSGRAKDSGNIEVPREYDCAVAADFQALAATMDRTAIPSATNRMPETLGVVLVVASIRDAECDTTISQTNRVSANRH